MYFSPPVELVLDDPTWRSRGQADVIRYGETGRKRNKLPSGDLDFQVLKTNSLLEVVLEGLEYTLPCHLHLRMSRRHCPCHRISSEATSSDRHGVSKTSTEPLGERWKSP